MATKRTSSIALEPSGHFLHPSSLTDEDLFSISMSRLGKGLNPAVSPRRTLELYLRWLEVHRNQPSDRTKAWENTVFQWAQQLRSRGFSRDELIYGVDLWKEEHRPSTSADPRRSPPMAKEIFKAFEALLPHEITEACNKKLANTTSRDRNDNHVHLKTEPLGSNKVSIAGLRDHEEDLIWKSAPPKAERPIQTYDRYRPADSDDYWIQEKKSTPKRRGIEEFMQPPPPNYICNRCGKKGHHLQVCPTNMDPAFDKPPDDNYVCTVCNERGMHFKSLCPLNEDPFSIIQKRKVKGIATPPKAKPTARGTTSRNPFQSPTRDKFGRGTTSGVSRDGGSYFRKSHPVRKRDENYGRLSRNLESSSVDSRDWAPIPSKRSGKRGKPQDMDDMRLELLQEENQDRVALGKLDASEDITNREKVADPHVHIPTFFERNSGRHNLEELPTLRDFKDGSDKKRALSTLADRSPSPTSLHSNRKKTRWADDCPPGEMETFNSEKNTDVEMTDTGTEIEELLKQHDSVVIEMKTTTANPDEIMPDVDEQPNLDTSRDNPSLDLKNLALSPYHPPYAEPATININTNLCAEMDVDFPAPDGEQPCQKYSDFVLCLILKFPEMTEPVSAFKSRRNAIYMWEEDDEKRLQQPTVTTFRKSSENSSFISDQQKFSTPQPIRCVSLIPSSPEYSSPPELSQMDGACDERPAERNQNMGWRKYRISDFGKDALVKVKVAAKDFPTLKFKSRPKARISTNPSERLLPRTPTPPPPCPKDTSYVLSPKSSNIPREISTKSSIKINDDNQPNFPAPKKYSLQADAFSGSFISFESSFSRSKENKRPVYTRSALSMQDSTLAPSRSTNEFRSTVRKIIEESKADDLKRIAEGSESMDAASKDVVSSLGKLPMKRGESYTALQDLNHPLPLRRGVSTETSQMFPESKSYVKQAREKINRMNVQCSISRRQKTFEDLKKFSESFNLNTPIPTDVAEIMKALSEDQNHKNSRDVSEGGNVKMDMVFDLGATVPGELDGSTVIDSIKEELREA